ncbi:MAG: ATP-binding protein [Actinomycetota bacterium]
MSGERVLALIHNARNRLAAVIGSVSAREAAELYIASSQLASALAILRLEDSECGIRREEADLEVFLSDLGEEAGRLAPPGVSTALEWDFSACPVRSWTFDTQLVRLVLIDALMNGWRHARSRVCLEAACRDGELHFAIEDDGPGFPPALLAASGDAGTRPPAPQGAGLGVKLAERVARLHSIGRREGRVMLSNCGGGGGGRFSLILP